MATLTNELVNTSSNDAISVERFVFTARTGAKQTLQRIEVGYSDLVMLHRLMEDYAEREQPYTLSGVLAIVLDRGASAIRNSWKWADVNKEVKSADKETSTLLNELMTDPAATKEDVLKVYLDGKARKEAIKQAARKTR